MLLFSVLVASKPKYGLMTDAGSSGTRIGIFIWDTEDKVPRVKPVIVNNEPLELKVDLRLAQAQTEEAVQSVFKPLLKYALDHIPKEFQNDASFYVFATAGMRLISEALQKQILDFTFNYISSNSPFKIKREYCKVISGLEEGVFGWISVNHLLDLFYENSDTVGTIDLGGASMQIAVELDGSTKSKESYEVTVGKIKKTVYSHSWLGYGADQAFLGVHKLLHEKEADKTKVIEHPCYNVGHPVEQQLGEETRKFIGSGNFNKCAALYKDYLAQDAFTSTKVPMLEKETKYVAMSTFGFVNEYFNQIGMEISSNGKFDDLRVTGSTYCGLTAQYLDTQPEIKDKKFRHEYCTKVAYEYAILVDGFKFTDGRVNVTQTTKINDISISWSLGAIVAESGTTEVVINPSNSTKKIIIIASVCVGIIAVVGIVLIALYLVRRKNDVSVELSSSLLMSA